MLRKIVFATFLTGTALLFVAQPADAAFRLRLEDVGSGKGVVISDGGVGDLSPDAGMIIFSGAVEGFSVNVTTGTSTLTGPLTLPGYYGGIDLNNISIGSASAGTLRIILEQDGFGATTPDGGVVLNNKVGGVLTGPLNSTVTFESFADDTNAVPDLGPDQPTSSGLASVIGLPTPNAVAAPALTFGSGAFSGSSSIAFNKTGTYSLYSVITITFDGEGSVSFNHITATNPAPVGLVLMASGAPVLALAWLRRRSAKVQAS